MARPKGFEPLTPKFVVWCSDPAELRALCVSTPVGGNGVSLSARTTKASGEFRLPGNPSNCRRSCAFGGWRAATGGSGIVRLKEVPDGPVWATFRLPPWASASSAEMARPSPVPPLLAADWKAAKTLSRTASGMPGPVSLTSITVTLPCRAARNRDVAAPAHLLEGLDGVAHQIGEDAVQLFAVGVATSTRRHVIAASGCRCRPRREVRARRRPRPRSISSSRCGGCSCAWPNFKV